MATTKKVLVLTFGFSGAEGVKASITITNVSDEIDDAAIKAAMTTVAANGVLGHKDVASGADTVLEANYVNTETEELAL